MSESVKSGSASPTKSSRKSVNSSPMHKQGKPSFQSTAASKNNKSYASIAKAKSNTISFERPTTVRKDITIYHEDKIMLSLITSEKKTPAKRDPILQDGNEPVQVFRPSYRPLSAERNASKKDDERMRARKKGEYNHVYNPRADEPKPQGIKAFVVVPPQSRDENPRRLNREVRYKSEIRLRNPLFDGDSSVERQRRAKRPGTPTDDHQRMNEKKYLLPSERGGSPKGGRVFRDSSINLGDYSSLGLGDNTERYTSKPLSEMETKVRGSIKGVIQYESGPNYREQVLTDKCSTVKFVDILRAQERTSRVFARKKTLEY